MNLKRLMKQICSGFLVLALVCTYVPAALAVPATGTELYANHYVINEGEISKNILDETACNKLDPTDSALIEAIADLNSTVDLWISSDDMSEEEYQIPYVVDGTGNTWYLQQIVLYNIISDRNESQILMDENDIAGAKSKADYSFNVRDIEIDPYTIDGYSWYDVCYGWTLTPPEQWDSGSSDDKTYTVTYDFGIPSDVNSIFPITQYGIRGNESTASYDYIKNAVENLSGGKIEGQNFNVAEGLNEEWKGFFGYTWNDSNTSYYYFDGWKAENDSVYKTGATVTASDALAGGDSEIKFTGVWKEVAKWSDEQLVAAEESVPLDVFTRGDNEDLLLIDQSTDTLTKEDNRISYTVSAAVNDDLLLKSNVPFRGEKFATFEIFVNVDPELEFVNQNPDGTVTLRMESKLVVPKTIETKNGSSAWTGDGTNWTVTFDPDELPSGENGLQICIQAEFTGEDYTIVSDVMTLTGLDFKLKEDVFESTGVAPQVSTSANMTAKMDLRNMAGPGGPTGWSNNRYRLWVVERLLGKNDANGEVWRTYFEGGVDDPNAYVHALQFLDYKLADYDLSADTLATLDANTVTATVIQSELVEVKPADITVYEGGDGGYDAVVGGTGTTTSNSLPHPMFTIKTPDGVEPEDLTFINGDKSWTVISDGNGYYHFSEGNDQDKVRVTYSYEDKDGVTHTVTEDAFDPATMGDVYGELTIELYPGENDLNDVTARTADGKIYRLSVGTGTLTVRAVQEDDATSAIEETAPAQKVSSGNAVAVAPAGTTYTLNNTGVKLPSDAIPSLLFDSIIENGNSTARTDALKEQASEWLDNNRLATGGTRHYEAKYLDLVDAKNGNAWIKASNPVTIYWGYPEGTGQSTDFKLLHFKDLHRDTSGGGNTGFDPDDIADSTIEEITVNNNANGISFTVGSGGFSPFVLVWTEASAPGPDPTPDPDPEPTPDPDEPGIADPDDTGVADWLNTKDHDVFLNGYPDGSFGPDRSMTRAEVAAMFSNLLLDKNVPITTSFSDVAEDAWYADAVNMLASLDMIAGYEDGTFRPDAPITRAEFTAIAMRFADAAPEGENIFSDVHAGDWFYDVVVGSIQYGWIGGYEDGTFRPQNTITRAEVTAITNRMLGRVADEAFIDAADALRSFSDLSDAHWAYYSIMEATNAHDYTTSDGVEEWEALH